MPRLRSPAPRRQGPARLGLFAAALPWQSPERGEVCPAHVRTRRCAEPPPWPSARTPPPARLARPLPASSATGPYLKSPSWYLPNACRTMVTTAMMGFTMQNCSVAWGTGSKGWLGGGWPGGAGQGQASRPAHLLAEAQEADGVGHALQAAGAVDTAGPGVCKSVIQGPRGPSPSLALPPGARRGPRGLWGETLTGWAFPESRP